MVRSAHLQNCRSSNSGRAQALRKEVNAIEAFLIMLLLLVLLSENR